MNGKPNTLRKQARGLVPRKKCEMCGGTETLHVHHKDGDVTNNAIKNLQVLCVKCHNKEHARMGTHRKLKDKKCMVCQSVFRPRRVTSVLCGNPICTSEWGKRSAERRWGSK